MSSRRCRFIENVERRLAVLKLEMTDISKSFFGVQVLHQVSLRVEKGTIHALIGENGAGKSTLMNILGGVYSLDNGIVKVDEKDVHDLTVRKAEALGIAFVHQEVNLFNDLLVYENIFMGKELTKHGLLNRKEMIQRTNALFADLHVDMKATDLVGTLSTGKKQLLEIAKALFCKASLFILDEPTTALSNEEINNLFRIINELKAQGNTFIFISHKMPEIFRLCDDYTVLRNGEMVLSGHLKDTNPQEVTKAIVGEKYQNKEVYASRELGPVCLRLVNYSGEGFSNINLEVHQGEIIGFTGLHGSGSSELMQAMFGITKATSGEFIANQKSLTGASVKKVMQNHIGMVPANRKENSVFGDLNLLDNLCIADFSVEPGPLFHLRREEKQFGRYQDELAIKANSQKDLLLSLSGGNQQKVIIARWLKTNADILLLDNPTQGIDVGAKNEIYRLLIQLAQSGKTILFNTLEIPEIQKCADRCVVFYHGRIEAVLERNEISDEKVMMYATHANKVGGDKQ
jgi:ribose transport system ATP-binding protein